MSQEIDQFPSPLHGDENSSLSSVSQQNQMRRSQGKRQVPQRSRKDDEEEESIFDDEDLSDDQNAQDGKGRNRMKKSNLFSISNKPIQKKIVPKHIDNKFKKTSGNQSTNPIATFLYKPGVVLPCLSPYINCMIAIRIAREYIQKINPAIINRQVWGGNGVYSSHSDAVAMGVHHGMLGLNDIKLTTELYEGVALICKVVKGKKALNGSFKPPLLSRSLKQQCPHCLKPEKTQWLTDLGSIEQLKQWAVKMAIPENKRLTKKTYMSLYNYDMAPPQKPSVYEILINKLIPPLNEGWIVWDMCNEPSQKFNVITFMDRQTSQGYKTNTSYKLRTHVLFIENKVKKFEISMDENMREEDVFLEQNIYGIAEINEPLKVDLEFMKVVGLPIPPSHKKDIFKSLKWEDFIWGQSTLTIKEKEFSIQGITCFKMVPLKMYIRPQ